MTENPRVHAVRTLEEARRVVLEAEDFSFRALLLRTCLRLWVKAVNLSLYILRAFFWGIPSNNAEFNEIVAYTAGILGDNVVILPALAALKQRYPATRLTVVADLGPYPKAPTELFESVTFVDRLIVLNDHPVRRNSFGFVLDPQLQSLRCDLFVDLAPYGNRGWPGAVVREMIFARRLGARRAIGFGIATMKPDNGKRGWLNDLQHYFVKNEPRRCRIVLKELGLEPAWDVDLLPESPASRESVSLKMPEARLSEHPLFVIHPGGNLPVKFWPAERFGRLASWLTDEYGADVVVTGTTAEKAVAEEVADAAGGRARNLAGMTSLQEMIELLRMARACITNDTGTMHLAAMIGVPTLAIFGMRITPTWWFPNGERVRAVFSPVDCRYCYQDECDRKECINAIDIDSVKSVTKSLLAGETW